MARVLPLCLLLFAMGCQPTLAQEAPHVPAVILKLDDLGYGEGAVHPGWQEVFEYLNENRVIATLGLVGSSLDQGDDAFFDWIKEQRARGHEVWNHGYCHCKPLDEYGTEMREFRGPGYAYQLEHLKRTQALAVEKLGEPLRSFGAPYNSTDSLTALALREVPGIEVWMYKDTRAPTDAYVLPRIASVNIEYPVHIPDFEAFKEGYMQNMDAPVLVIQGHPRSWHGSPERMAEFKRIVEFLIGQGTAFTTPYAYYAGNRD